MATVTTNYGFDVPQSTDLVKNGATQIALLGEDIDTFLFRPFTQNVIINGGFDFFQRGTSASGTGWTCADRWYNVVAGTTTFSRDTSVPITAGVQYSYKWTTSASSSYGQIYTALESAIVTALRGQSMAFSFWVKTTGTAFTGAINADAYYSTSSDSYGSLSIPLTIEGAQNITPTSTWTKYSGTFTMPSTAVGLKIGVIPTAVQASGVVVYFTAFQLEVGSQATPFARAGGTIQGELAACQRYYFRFGGDATYQTLGFGTANGTTTAALMVTNPVPMRIAPTSVDFSTLGLQTQATGAVNALTTLSIAVNQNGKNAVILNAGGSGGLTSGQPQVLLTNNSTSGYVGLSAEL